MGSSDSDKSFPFRAYAVLAAVSRRYSPLSGRFPYITHPCATGYCYPVRLACLRPAASVRSEPGSNSQIEKSESVWSAHRMFNLKVSTRLSPYILSVYRFAVQTTFDSRVPSTNPLLHINPVKKLSTLFCGSGPESAFARRGVFIPTQRKNCKRKKHSPAIFFYFRRLGTGFLRLPPQH